MTCARSGAQTLPLIGLRESILLLKIKKQICAKTLC